MTNGQPGAGLRDIDVAIEDRHKSELSPYAALRAAGGVLHVIAAITFLAGGLVIIGGLLFLAFALNTPMLYAIVGSIAIIVVGVSLFFVAFNISLTGERIALEVESVTRLRQIALAVCQERDEADARDRKMDIKLHAIASNTARTADAVEMLVDGVRNRRPTKPTGTFG